MAENDVRHSSIFLKARAIDVEITKTDFLTTSISVIDYKWLQ